MPRIRLMKNPKTGTWDPVEKQLPRPRVHLHTDYMEETWHPATNVHTESKSNFRKMTKAAGCEEVGNEYVEPTRTNLSAEDRRQDIMQAMEK